MDTKLCVVAGAGPGVGFHVAKRFHEGGFTVALLSRRQSEVDELARQLGERAHGFAVDLCDADATTSLLQRIRTSLGPVDTLAYNAALWHNKPAMQITPQEFQTDLALCATGAFVCAQAVYLAMRQAGQGTILFTGGGLALYPEYGAGVASLTAGKSALRGLTFALAKELAADGIHVATVTIAGTVAAGTPFDPARIAERYWALYEQPREQWTVEEVFRGS